MTEQRTKIALVGSATSSCHLTPYDDPSWEIWGLAWRAHPQDMKRADVLFEIHDRQMWKACQGGSDEVLAAYVKMLQTTDKPVYLLKQEEDIPTGIAFPMAECTEAIGADYYASSIGYMLALLILQQQQGRVVEEVGLYGIDLLCDDEWAYQRPNTEYLLGILKGRGAEIVIPETSALLKINHKYGVEAAPIQGGVSPGWLGRQIEELQSKHAHMLQGHHTYDGAYQAADLFATDPEAGPENEREWLRKFGATPEQRALAAERARVFQQKKQEHLLQLCKMDGGLEMLRYTKAMAEHHLRHGVIPG